jgi:hypothetical protein
LENGMLFGSWQTLNAFRAGAASAEDAAGAEATWADAASAVKQSAAQIEAVRATGLRCSGAAVCSRATEVISPLPPWLA